MNADPNPWKHHTLCAILLAALGAWPLVPVSAAAAETKPAGNLPSVDQILDKHIEAIGGKAALKKLTSRTVKGSADMPAAGTTFNWDFYAKAPNKQASFIEIPGFGIVREGFDGQVAWSQNPGAGVREKSGEELAKQKRDADFYRDLNLKTIFPNLACKGLETVGNEETYVVEAKPSDGSLERFYFSKKNGLLRRQDSELEMPEGKIQTSTFIEEYRAVDGVKLPSVLRITANVPNQPEMVFTLKFTEIRHNVPIEDGKFAKPQS